MGDVKKFDSDAILCKVCRKRKAVVLCDAITGIGRYVGHPPKVDGVISNEPMESVDTCDIPMCNKCTSKVTEYMDLCPYHVKSIVKE